MAAAGVLALSLVNGMMTASAASAASFTAYASGLGPDEAIAYNNAMTALNQKYTGCTDIHFSSAVSTPNYWIVTVAGTCTGTA
jgi:hypothetical protein